jgi:Cu(I)/Ag(I) efflux system membrane fusion protein/cobalt-zinc-cadmium efflux system membrane fusion protein
VKTSTRIVIVALACASAITAIALSLTNSAKPSTIASSNTAMKPPVGAGPKKQLWHCGMHPQVVQDHPGECPICHMALTPITTASATPGQRKILYWWDPMLGPSSITDHPGKSAMGMDLVPVYAEEAGPSVTIDPTVVQNMGVRTAKVERGPLTKTIRAVGLLKLPEPGMHDVTLKVSGWIDKLYADQDGKHVVQGEPLFDLYSPELQIAEQELIVAVKSERTLPSDAAANLRQDTQSLIDSAKRKLRLWDVAEQDIEAIAKADQPPKDVAFRSPATGHIEEKMVVQGSAVQPMMRLMRVADQTKMWLDAQIYQEQIPLVKIGQPIAATVDGMPDKTWKGSISFIYPHLDHMTRTLTVRMTIDNPDFELKPGMYATATIATKVSGNAVVVPREAVIDTGTKQITFVVDDANRFVPRMVHMGVMGDDDKVQIIEGLAPGETVVTSGQFLMDVESRTIEATQKLLAPVVQATSQQITTTPSNTTSAPPMEAIPMETKPQTKPATTQQTIAKLELSVAYCPMVKQYWLQEGETILNPYTGQEMSDCGDVKRKVIVAANSPLASAVQSYLKVEKSLNSDKLDADAIKALSSDVNKLPADQYAPLRTSATKLANAKDLAAARDAFHVLSDRLIQAIEGHTR